MKKAAFPGRTQMKVSMEDTLNNEAEKGVIVKCFSTATAFGVPRGRVVADWHIGPKRRSRKLDATVKSALKGPGPALTRGACAALAWHRCIILT
jgi:hypothetical protein